MDKLKVGDIVVLHKPKTLDGNPYWAPEMDVYDGSVGEIYKIYKSLNGRHTYVKIREFGSWAFNIRWFEPLGEEADENIVAEDLGCLI